MKIPHYGLFWEKVKKDFPKCEHAPSLRIAPDSMDKATGLPVPRIWLINNADNRLIQIERESFFFNWRKRKENEKYPRYGQIDKLFRKYFRIFKEFVEENGIGIIQLTGCELTYVNYITPEHGWASPKDLVKVFDDFVWHSKSRRFLPDPVRVAWNVDYELPDGKGVLSVKAEQATRRADNLPILRLDLSARGISAEESPDNLGGWFSIAHEWIVRGFTDLTTSEIQEKVWKRDDDYAG